MLRRGFPAEADRLATTVRAGLGLAVHDRLDPHALAAKYGIDVAPITDLVAEGADPASIRQVTVVDRSCFSAGTVIVADYRLIIFNPSHSDGRLANSVAHEVAHYLLKHTPGPALGPGGCRVWDQEMEDEADRLACALLVSREAVLACARAGLPHCVGAARFGVSSELMLWRTNQTGAGRQAYAEARRRGRAVSELSPGDARVVASACDLGWLQNVTTQEWQAILAACGRAIATGSVDNLTQCLKARTVAWHQRNGSAR